ncbi:MAG: 4Fe-4S binding protein [Lachnospiraceae bacterium]|jgi:NAD-dependent dihydropyrimidine dehydrogenase PreA subunit|nr:4Fe-4S binding protein [Lachnospiraceae bacterium]
MGILSRQITDTFTRLPHPELQKDACINQRQRRMSCDACARICPEQVFSGVPATAPDWTRCTDCGLCVSACPSRALAPSCESHKKYLEGRDLSRTVLIGCKDDPQECHLKVACLASLPWELIAYLALHTKVVLYLNACPQCTRTGNWEQLRVNLRQVMIFLGEEEYSRRILLLQGRTYEEEIPSFSRRHLFSQLTKTMTRAALDLVPKLPGEKDGDGDGLIYRYLLSQALAEHTGDAGASPRVQSMPESPAVSGSNSASVHRTYTVSLPQFTDQCYGCGSCITLCPGKALQLSEEAGGLRTMYITPWRCSACGLCETVCRQNGVTAPRPFALERMSIQPLVNIHTVSCSVCGKPVPPKNTDGMCVICRQRARRKR